MGFLMDVPGADGGPWLVVKVCFATLFWIEIIVKVSLLGWRKQYLRRNSAISNLFDSVLVLVDSLDILLSFFKTQLPGGNTILIFRTIRLLRVVRLFRIFKAPIFDDLVAMVYALFAGSATLLWSVIFFLCFVYATSLLFRAGFGPHPDDPQQGTTDPAIMEFYFQNVPRALLTTYRCSVGDCSTRLGTPMLESTEHEHGTLASLLLSCLLFLASVGLFNIMGAVFLERIMTYAAAKSLEKQRARLNDKRLWNDNVSRFIDLQLQLHDEVTRDDSGEIEPESLHLNSKVRKQDAYKYLTNMTNEALLQKTFHRELVDLSVQTHKEAKQILANLDIEEQDCLNLSDVLDKNKNGLIDIMELISGLRRLRGPARRGDIAAVDLAIQSIQARVDEMWLSQMHRQHLQQQQHQTSEEDAATFCV